jgi:hypothetical protein
MENESTDPEDPEIAALLGFTPVERKCKRRDGWTPDNQRRYIAGLAETGNVDQAAHRLGRTMSGAYKVRTAAGGESFAAAWDGALALHLRRNPRPLPKGRPSRGEILAGSGRAWPARAPAAPAPAPEPSEAEKAKAEEECFDRILERYFLKLRGERAARLAGRIAEADFTVRQLTHIELILDLGGRSLELLRALKRGGHNALDIVATPMSLLLDQVRRLLWQEGGEPERPPLPPLGEHDREISTGPRTWWSSNGDEDLSAWQRRRGEEAAEAAEAQRLWEEKARAEAAAWRARVGGGGDAGGSEATEARP